MAKKTKNKLDRKTKALLKKLCLTKMNIDFLGATDSGMTTYLRAMYSGEDRNKRLVILEDASELSLPPKPTIVGEIREKEAFTIFKF